MVVHLHQVFLVEAVNAEKTVRMFQYDKVAVTGNPIAAIDHFPGRCGNNSCAIRDIYLYSLVNILPLCAELVQQLSFDRPDKQTLDRPGDCGI